MAKSKGRATHDDREVSAVALQAIRDEINGADRIGKEVGVEQIGTELLIVTYEALLPGYVGWRWVVTLARLEKSQAPTVCEVVLLPGPE
jgi:hypothetical protein